MFIVHGKWSLRFPSPKQTSQSRETSANSSQTRFTKTPHTPILQSQFFSQSYESILPNSFTHILLCTRGCSPWKPEAVLSTKTRWKNLWGIDPAVFKERHERSEWVQKNEPTLPRTQRLLSVKEFRRVVHLKYVKKKRGLFSDPMPPCRSLVALPRNLPQLTSFWNFNQIPFRGMLFQCKH